MPKEESEFGKGFTYCLGLFLAHAESGISQDQAGLWFNVASDHLYDMEIPLKFSMALECEVWRRWVLDLGHGSGPYNRAKITQKDRDKAIQQAKDFLRAWDKDCKIKTAKGRCE